MGWCCSSWTINYTRILHIALHFLFRRDYCWFGAKPMSRTHSRATTTAMLSCWGNELGRLQQFWFPLPLYIFLSNTNEDFKIWFLGNRGNIFWNQNSSTERVLAAGLLAAGDHIYNVYILSIMENPQNSLSSRLLKSPGEKCVSPAKTEIYFFSLVTNFWHWLCKLWLSFWLKNVLF